MTSVGDEREEEEARGAGKRARREEADPGFDAAVEAAAEAAAARVVPEELVAKADEARARFCQCSRCSDATRAAAQRRQRARTLLRLHRALAPARGAGQASFTHDFLACAAQAANALKAQDGGARSDLFYAQAACEKPVVVRGTTYDVVLVDAKGGHSLYPPDGPHGNGAPRCAQPPRVQASVALSAPCAGRTVASLG